MCGLCCHFQMLVSQRNRVNYTYIIVIDKSELNYLQIQNNSVNTTRDQLIVCMVS